MGPDGALWFTEFAGNNIGRITTSGALSEYPVPTSLADPEGITAGPDGAPWFTEAASGKIGRISPLGVVTSEFVLPNPGCSPTSIATGSDGALWFAEYSGNNIGRITLSGAITEYPLPVPGASPSGVTSGPDGAIWFTEEAGAKIGRITTSGVVAEYPILAPDAVPQAITTGPDGALWFTEYSGNNLGRITTAGVVAEYAVPTLGAGLPGIVTGPEGALWFTERIVNRIGRAALDLLVTVVKNGASYQVGPLAPGEIIAIFGTNLGGPSAGAFGVITGNTLGNTVGDVQVLFDNTAAPLLYVSDVQINCIVPFELSGRFQTHMQVTHSGAVSGTIYLNVTSAAPGLFTAGQSGSGQGAILNSDFSVNGTENPAPQGSYVLVYGTGGGQTNPLGVTGNITPSNGSGLKTIAGVTATVGGQPATVLYAGSAPGFVEGAMQFNVQLPAGLPPGPQPVVIAVNGVSSQSSLTVVVQ